MTDTGAAAREQVEVETDQHCTALWEPIGNEGARRLASLIAKIDDAFTTAGTYSQFRGTQPTSELRPQRRLE